MSLAKPTSYYIRALNRNASFNRNPSLKRDNSGLKSEEIRASSKIGLHQQQKITITSPSQLYYSKLENLKSNIIKKREIIDLPIIPSPRHQPNNSNNSLSKLRSSHNLSNNQVYPTPRRLKSDQQDNSDFLNKKQNSQHNHPRINIKPRLLSNYTPLTKIKTEPSEIVQSPIIFTNFDDSRDILYQLQKKQQITAKSQDEPYHIQNTVNQVKNISMIKKKKTKSNLNDKYHIEIPIYDEDSQFFENEEPKMKVTQKNKQPLINQATKDKILDLLFLSTAELKQKFNNEKSQIQQSKIQQSKISNRQINKMILPKNFKSKFPNDFFTLLNNDSQIV